MSLHKIRVFTPELFGRAITALAALHGPARAAKRTPEGRLVVEWPGTARLVYVPSDGREKSFFSRTENQFPKEQKSDVRPFRPHFKGSDVPAPFPCDMGQAIENIRGARSDRVRSGLMTNHPICK